MLKRQLTATAWKLDAENGMGDTDWNEGTLQRDEETCSYCTTSSAESDVETSFMPQNGMRSMPSNGMWRHAHTAEWAEEHIRHAHTADWEEGEWLMRHVHMG